MIRRFLTNRWFLGSLGVLALTALVLFIGPLISIGGWVPLRSLLARWILIGVIIGVWIARRLLAFLKARRADSEIVEGIISAPVAEAEPESPAEVALLKERFEEAIGVIRQSKSRGSRISLYELPWYVIIGPPGAGKTTALVNSGLRFPLSERFGPDAVRGVGGTRNCDWWFTDESVIIDTAGRYTTQDSDAEGDQSAWLGFLDLLKKHRKRRPINGIFVAISLADLMTQTEHERRQQAQAIQSRIHELNTHFGISFPVYALFTKSDLVAGFNEFFENLSRSEREQVWGVTFPYEDERQTSPLRDFQIQYENLVLRLEERLIERLNSESDRERRIRIHGFPRQMRSIAPILQDFLLQVFEGSRFQSAPILRGFYFTSGTQEGTPIDRIMSAMARTFQIDPGAAEGKSGSGKSFFVTDVFKRVVFGETELAGTNRRIERQRAWIRHASFAGIAATAVLLIIGWVVNYGLAKRDLSQTQQVAEAATDSISRIDNRNLDPLSVSDVLDAVRAIPGGYGDRDDGSTPWRLGLSQSSKVGDSAVNSYRRLLNELYLPRLQLRLERQLQRGGASPDYTYEALKTYLMLDSSEHYDADTVRAFIEFDWLNNLRREVSTEQRETLVAHLQALLEERPASLPLPLDGGLIEQARTDVRGLPLEYRIYGRLQRLADIDGDGFNVRTAAGGANADFVFVRKSGKSLADPLPPLYTKKAYQRYFVDSSKSLTADIVDESWWILGEAERIDSAEEARLLENVRALYLEDFATEYINLVEDIDLAPFNSADEATRILTILSRPEDSPLLLLIESIANETALDRLADGASIGDRVESGAAEALERIQGVLGANDSAADSVATAISVNSVSSRFERLNRLVEAEEGQPRPIDRLLVLIKNLSEYMSTVSSEAAGGAIPPHVQAQGQAVTQQLKIEASTQPELLVGEILDTSANRSIALTTGGLRNYLNDLWRSGPLQTCRAAIASRYPIAKESQRTIRLDDFGQFFGYGGVIDSFFNNHLRQYVDSTRSPWRARRTGNTPIGLSAQSLKAFEQADIIRRTYFRVGSMQPSVAFDLRPLEMDTRLSRFLLDLEGKTLTYEFGARVPTFLQWPGPNPGSEVRIEMRDRQTGQTTMDRRQGPWAWFRLLDNSSFESTPVPEQFEVTFTLDGRTVTYDLIARSAYNPFSLSELRNFRCPERL